MSSFTLTVKRQQKKQILTGAASYQGKRRRSVPTNQALEVLSARVQGDLHVRKTHFNNVRKHLRGYFKWDTADRDELIAFLRTRGWTVVLCITEADVKIAEDCMINDVVVSRDSDMLMTQWTSVGVVNKNDYTRNIKTLGISTNYDFIKSLDGGQDVHTLIQQYLQLDEVVLKNMAGVTFLPSINVFVHRRQTPITSIISPPTDDLTYDDLRREIERVCKVFDERKRELQAAKKDVKRSRTWAPRHKVHQHYNHFRTIDHAPPGPRVSMSGFQAPMPALPTSASAHAMSESDLQAPMPTSTMLGSAHPMPVSGLQAPTDASPEAIAASYSSVSAFCPPALALREPDPAPASTKEPHHRSRYSFKERRKRKKHDPPEDVTQFKSKSYKEPPDPPVATSTLKASKTKGIRTAVTTTRKSKILDALSFEHPLVTLDVGTVRTNTRDLHETDITLAGEVVECIQGAAQEASSIKRKCQRLVSLYLHRVSRNTVDDSDRQIMQYLCKPITAEDVRQTDTQLSLALPTTDAVVTPAPVLDAEMETVPAPVLDAEMETVPAIDPAMVAAPALDTEMNTAPAIELDADGVGVQEDEDDDKNEQKLKRDMSLGLLPPETIVDLRSEIPSIENFIQLNAIANQSRVPIPLSPVKHGFVTFSEYDLAAFFWKHDKLRERLKDLMVIDLPSDCRDKFSQIWCTNDWFPGKPPEYLIKSLICDVAPDGLTVRQRGKAGLRAAIKPLSLEQLKNHINGLRLLSFDPRTCTEMGYVIRGSIKTDGYRLQLLAYKLRELQSVRFRRYKAKLLPNRLLSTTGGTDHFLTEIRNIVTCPKDVEDLLGCTTDKAFAVGASAVQATPPKRRRRKRNKRRKRRGSRGKKKRGGDSKTTHPDFYNLA
ncbi:hypothetical protein DFQ26_009246, partial [Actinomortierella ambigua]